MLSICSFHFKFSPIIIPKHFEFENVSFDWLKGVFLELYGKHGKIHSHLGQYGKFTLVITLTLITDLRLFVRHVECLEFLECLKYLAYLENLENLEYFENLEYLENLDHYVPDWT